MKTNPNDAAAVIALLAETWPTTFFVYEQRRRPLERGIHQGILAALDGAMTPQELRRALRYYVGKWYLRALVAGAARLSLDGSPAGEPVSAEEAAAAAARLAGYAARRCRQTPSISAPAPGSALTSAARTTSAPAPVPGRISLADLRHAAQLRKARDVAAA